MTKEAIHITKEALKDGVKLTTGKSYRIQIGKVFKNLRWMNEGKKITRCHIGDKVFITADVSGIMNGTELKATIYEKDYNNENDYIRRVSGEVKGGKIEIPWEVEYHEDNDDTGSREEEETLGYTLPEYIVFLEGTQPNKIKSEESPVLEVYVAFAYKVVDCSGTPLKDRDYYLTCADGTVRSGKTNSRGFILEKEIPPNIASREIYRLPGIYRNGGTGAVVKKKTFSVFRMMRGTR